MNNAVCNILISKPLYVVLFFNLNIKQFCSYNKYKSQEQQNDHLSCFKVKDKLKFPKSTYVDMMANRFQKKYSINGCKMDKKGATKFCVPSTKTVTEGNADPSLGGLVPKYDSNRAIQNDLLCYKARCRDSIPNKFQKVIDQFGPANAKIMSRKLKVVAKSIEICTPAWKLDDDGNIILINDYCDWVKFDDKNDLFAAALSPDGAIGDGSDKKCRILDRTESAGSACDYYVRYTEDNGATWLGMTFEGVPGGTGCPAVGMTTVEQTIEFLQKYYIDEGYCGCTVKDNCDWHKFDDKNDLFAAALAPDGAIGDGSDKKCRILDRTEDAESYCNYYVRYTEDNGATWLGMTFEGVPGGTGCTTTVEQTIEFLQKYYIDEGYCGCVD